MANETEKPLGPRAKLGRKVAFVVYLAFAGFLAVASVWQITRHVFFPSSADAPPFSSCRDGLAALYQAIERGRLAAEHGPDDGEEAALLRFRETVAPDWRHRDAVAELCRSAPQEISARDAIERLRYAEENAVRREAGDLAPLRRKVQAIVDHDLAPDAGKSSP